MNCSIEARLQSAALKMRQGVTTDTYQHHPFLSVPSCTEYHNIQFTANYRVRILITSVLYFTSEYRTL